MPRKTIRFVVSPAPSSSAPAWLAGIPLGQWADIGLNTLNDVKSPLFSQNSFNYLLDIWCGGCAVPDVGEYGSLFVWGTGHNGYLGNEFYAFDLGTRLWGRYSEPYPPPHSYPYSGGLFPDGSPVLQHTYDRTEYDPNTRSVLVYGLTANAILSESDSGNQNFSRGAAFNIDTKQWRATPIYGNIPGPGPGSGAAYDPVQQVYWLPTRNGNAIIRFDPVTMTATSFPHTVLNIFQTEYIPKVNADYPDGGLVVYTQSTGNGSQIGIQAFLPSNPSAPRVRLNVNGTFPSAAAGGVDTYCGLAWSPRRQALLYWRRGSGVYQLKLMSGPWNTGQWTWSLITDPANTVVPQSQVADNGPYGRFRVHRWGNDEVCLAVSRVSGPTYAFRVP